MLNTHIHNIPEEEKCVAKGRIKKNENENVTHLETHRKQGVNLFNNKNFFLLNRARED